LIDSGVFPLSLMGKAMKYFGPSLVIAFLFGFFIACLYSRFDFLPLRDTLFSSTLPKEDMSVSGHVTDWKGKPLQGAMVYTVPSKYQQLTRDDGIFNIKVTPQEYAVIVVDPQDDSKHVIHNAPSENLIFKIPPESFRLEGTVTDRGKPQNNREVKLSGGFLQNQLCATTDAEGKYIFDVVPAVSISESHLTIAVGGHSEPIEDSIDAYTVKEFNIKLDSTDPIVTGFVKDSRGTPVPNVRVAIDQRYGAITAYDGRYSINVPTLGSHIIQVWHGDQRLFETEIGIDKDNFTYDIGLR
jgi:hypothetical protein